MDDILDCVLPLEPGRGGHRHLPCLAAPLHTSQGMYQSALPCTYTPVKVYIIQHYLLHT